LHATDATGSRASDLDLKDQEKEEKNTLITHLISPSDPLHATKTQRVDATDATDATESVATTDSRQPTDPGSSVGKPSAEGKSTEAPSAPRVTTWPAGVVEVWEAWHKLYGPKQHAVEMTIPDSDLIHRAIKVSGLRPILDSLPGHQRNKWRMDPTQPGRRGLRVLLEPKAIAEGLLLAEQPDVSPAEVQPVTGGEQEVWNTYVELLAPCGLPFTEDRRKVIADAFARQWTTEKLVRAIVGRAGNPFWKSHKERLPSFEKLFTDPEIERGLNCRDVTDWRDPWPKPAQTIEAAPPETPMSPEAFAKMKERVKEITNGLATKPADPELRP
jgi:hypothetical protein